MRYTLFLAIYLISITILSGQDTHPSVVDVIFLKSGEEEIGTILEYEYNIRAVILTQTGRIKEIDWKEIRRIGFELDKRAMKKVAEETKAPDDVKPQESSVPERKIQHHVSAGGLFGAEASPFSSFGRNLNIIGIGLNYFAIKPIGNLRVGLGADVATLAFSRRENTAAALALFEYAFPMGAKERIAFYARIIGGPAIPYGSQAIDSEITARSVGFLYNPSIGVEFRSGGHEYDNIFIDVGYRFLDSRFTLQTRTLDVLERTVNYRRVTVRGGYRF